MKTLACLLPIVALMAAPTQAQVRAQANDAPAPSPISLADLARKADMIALAQARDTDYFTRRDIPVSGSAYLRILIPYKLSEALDIVEVFEKGLHENECYFPNPSVFEEGRRYLLFLKKDPDHAERYRGLDEGCAIEVLVRRDNRYAVRFPVIGIDLADPLDSYAKPMEFSDPYAVIDDDALAAAERDALLAAGLIAPFMAEDADALEEDPAARIPGAVVPEAVGRRWIFTHGIELSTVRELMGPAAISTERHLKNPN
ncbi:MAG: hypothetical protein RQ826_08325 [Xanthomonadales bacterium]|nr:hypothetical protein [Xanthomonadales bacterium]